MLHLKGPSVMTAPSDPRLNQHFYLAFSDFCSQTVLVDVEGGCERPLAGHAAHVAAGPQLVALLEAEGAVHQGGQVHQVDAAEGLEGVQLSSWVNPRVNLG